MGHKKSKASKLELASLSSDSPERPGMNKAWGAVFAEVASVCLEKNGHGLEAKLIVEGDCSDVFVVVREKPTQDAMNFNNDDQRSAEFGAYGMSALLAPKLIKMTLVKASQKGTGFDFWIGPIDENSKENSYFQNKARLEVSGIMNGSRSNVQSRVKTKLKQIEPTDNTPYPGFVSVVEFGQFLMVLVKKKVTPSV